MHKLKENEMPPEMKGKLQKKIYSKVEERAH
jgi:hypothetical protein